MRADLLDDEELWHPDGFERCGMCERQMPQPYAYEGHPCDGGRMALGEPLCERCARAVIDDEAVKVYRAPLRAALAAREVDGDVPVRPAPRPARTPPVPEPDPVPVSAPQPVSAPEPALTGTVVTAAERSRRPQADYGLPRPGLLSISRWVGTGW